MAETSNTAPATQADIQALTNAIKDQTDAINKSMEQTVESMQASEKMNNAIKGMKASSMANGFGSAAASTLQAITAVVSARIQKRIMNEQKKMAKNQYTHQSKMARIDRNAKTYKLEKDQELINYQVAGQKKYLAAVRDAKRSEGQLAIVEAKIKEQKLTDKMGKLDDYPYGKPAYS
jgi:hypothetical protein